MCIRDRPITDAEAMEGFQQLTRLEGIIPAIESSHAVAAAVKVAAEKPGATLIVNVSGRGDKDVTTAAKWFDMLGQTSKKDS